MAEFPAMNSPQRAGARRKKVILGPGKSALDWVRKNSAHRRVIPRQIPPSELCEHITPDSYWMSINGRVYDLTDYMSFHPGGVEELLRGVGKDATFEFEQVHRWVNYETILSSYYIGQLVDEETYQRNKMLLEKQNQNGDEDEDEDELENFQFTRTYPSKTASGNHLIVPGNQFITPQIKTSTSTSTNEIPKPKVKIDFHQSDTHVVLTFYLRGIKSHEIEFTCDDESFKLEINSDSLKRFVQSSTFTYNYQTAKPILGAESTYKLHITKIEVFLKKYDPKVHWDKYGTESEPSPPTSLPITNIQLNTTPVPKKDQLQDNLYYECELISINEISYNVKLFRFKYSNELNLTIPIGAHISFRAVINGRVVFRDYTPVSDLSNVFNLNKHKKQENGNENENGHENGTENGNGHVSINENENGKTNSHYFDVVIKLYEEGAFSEYLSKLELSDKSLTFSNPRNVLGEFNLKNITNVGLIAAGSGITPMIRILEHFLIEKSEGEICLLYVNSTEKDIIYHDIFNELESKFPKKFRVKYVLSKPSDSWQGYTGRVNQEMISEVFSFPIASSKFFICGPSTFNPHVMKLLFNLNFKQHSIVQFS